MDSLNRTFNAFTPWETFMSDGGKHFDNKDVHELCRKWGTKYLHTHHGSTVSLKVLTSSSSTYSNDYAHQIWTAKKQRK
jgi:hypothetical protein